MDAIEKERKREQEEDNDINIKNVEKEKKEIYNEESKKKLFNKYNIKSKFITIYDALSPSNFSESMNVSKYASDLLLTC